MLLQHAWLAPLQKPAMILEEDEEAPSPVEPVSNNAGTGANDGKPDENTDNGEKTSTPTAAPSSMTQVVDKEVAEWVLQALDRRRQSRADGGKGGGNNQDGTATGCGGETAKPQAPALHAAPLDAVSPALERKEVT